MTMPPSGIDGLMDEQAVIEAEIYQELENINLDDEVPQEIEEPPEPEDNGFPIHDELDDYIRRLQDQSNRFEAELEECDELLEHNSQKRDVNVSNALIPYEDHDLLAQLAREHGCDIEEYRRKILDDIENDEIIIEDELEDLIDDDTDVINNDNDGTSVNDDDNKLPVQIGRAVEEGVDTEEIPVSQALVAVNNIGTSHKKQIEMQQMLKDELIRVESRFEDRLGKMKKDDEFRKDEENLRQKRVMEERQWKKEEIQRQEKQMMFDREMAEREALKAQEELEREMAEKMKQFEIEMATLQAENEKLRREYELEIEMERDKFAEKQDNVVRRIQRVFRGYRVRKEVGPELSAQREIRRKQREEERIKELEIVIENRKLEQQQKEELERQKKEEEKRQKVEEKRKREEEKKKLEEKKKQKKLEEERIKQEEKKRKEEEKQRKKEEEKQRKEEEKRKKEEQKRLKEEEDKRRKEEQKRLKEEEEQRKKEEQKKKEEEERQRKEEAIRMKEEEKRKQEEEKRNLDAEKKLKEEKLIIEQEKIENKDGGKKENETKDEEATKNDTDAVNSNLVEKQREINQEDELTMGEKDEAAQSDINDTNTNNTMSEVSIRDCPENIGEGDFEKMGEVGSEKVSVKKEEKVAKQENSQRSETPRSARRPKSARFKPSTPRREKKDEKEPKSNDSKKTEMNTDCLPKNLETLRLKFIEDCIPWSKVSNEPWKLKAGLSRKPLRRPSSAKKLPSLPEDLIIQSAKVASLKMVTTVELKDLPGNNISTLGQCGGLKYLTLNNCNLVALDGLSQCRQLQYIDVQNNKIEYVDLKDLGQLQYLNLSHNKLSSIHGLDSCTNLRWLDLSHNNITRLGGMETLRRLFCLKLSHCQLISTQGLGATPTLQMLDISSNHLQSVEDLDKLCLLLSLNASANNILQVPNLKNQVLLTELNLSNNSLSSLSGIGSVWLPLLCSLDVEQNSLTDLSSLQNCLLLKKLNLDENQVTDVGIVLKCVDQCFYMEELTVLDNPVETDINDSFYSKLRASCPRVNTVKDGSVSTKPRTSMEAMCLTQQSTLTEAFSQFEKNLRINGEQLNQANICDDYYKFCDRVFNMSVEYRYSHEYGEVTFIPSAPTAPKSGRPLSSRQREKFSNPKDMFENALRSSSDTHSMEKNSISPQNMNRNQVINDPKDLFEKALNGQSSVNQVTEPQRSHSGKSERPANTSINAQSSYANPRDLFEQALKSADSTSSHNHVTNGHNSNLIKPNTRGDKYADAAVRIQAAWRGYACRKSLHAYKNSRQIDIDPALVERVYNSAVIIQATWRGYILRKKLLAALEYAQCDFDDDVEDPDMMDFGDEFDFEKFVDVNQDLLDTDWRPPSTPDIPNSYAVLRKPPSGKPRVPPINMADVHPPSNPRRAWRNAESPLSDLGGKVPRPPSSLASTELTVRSVASRKEEKMAEEWGFKDSNTAHLMMQRAKKMKLNADKRKKLSKLDPKQRLALFRKLEEVTHPVQPTVKQSRKTLPRKEYFQARQEEFVRQEREKHQEYQVKASRTFEWLHSQVGDHVVTDSVINQGFTEGPKYVPMDHNLPELIGGGKRIHLVSSPMSVELQSVDSVSTTGQKPRRFSAGSGSSTSKLPPIQPTSAPAPHAKERMSFRNAPTNQSVGWGGGKKRGNYL